MVSFLQITQSCLSLSYKIIFLSIILFSTKNNSLTHKLDQGEVFRSNRLIRFVESLKTKMIYCYYSKERQISIVMFIQSNLLF